MSNRLADNIKLILKKYGAAIGTAFIWPKTEFGGGLSSDGFI
jgi:hypothetical protein